MQEPGARVRILALEPYYGGSHRSMLDGLVRHSRHDFEVLTMPARKWKWRMRGAAIELAERAAALGRRFDVLLAADMMSVADFRALGPKWLRDVPIVTYFHENQLTYPAAREAEIDYQYGFTNITSCLASDEVWFNSAYNMDEFLAAARRLLRKMPDCIPVGVPDAIRAKSRVVYPGIEAVALSERERHKPYTIVWNHRWEWDKNPETFFAALAVAKEEGRSFRLAVLGESFREAPAVFRKAREKFAAEVVRWGYVASHGEYLKALGECDIAVSTARHEFFGLAALEAAACGCALLLPRRLAYPEIFDAGANGWAFYDEGELAGRLCGMLDEEGLPTRRRSVELAQQYTWPGRIGEWDELLGRAGG